VLETTMPLSAAASVEQSDRDVILRFHPSERQMHWAVAIPFMVCYASALVLIFIYNPHPSLPYRRIVSWGHRLSGLCLLTLPLVTAVRHRHDARIHVHNVRKVWAWDRSDVAWLLRIVPASLSCKVSLPHQGKFNAGEKINFMALTCTYPLLLGTGLVIWFGGVPYLSWLAHFLLAAIATPLVAGHIFMATVNPDTRPGLSGMITGRVDRRWASHHYHHWYQELYGCASHGAQCAAVPGATGDRTETEAGEAAAVVARPDSDVHVPEPAGAGRAVQAGTEQAEARARDERLALRRRRSVRGALEAGAAMVAGSGGADVPAGQ
jgi:formate dehydrogenase subunit gamma